MTTPQSRADDQRTTATRLAAVVRPRWSGASDLFVLALALAAGITMAMAGVNTPMLGAVAAFVGAIVTLWRRRHR
ncbi:hypothetical protein [Nocardia sp. NPDC056000]|uniref:hypothetical protein n=1 Tax=Nocardia sp. NPDC056000 TaxID=3345674 RepID=UPI0035E1EF91